MNYNGDIYLVDFKSIAPMNDNPTILRILMSDAYTQIEFGYVAPWMYIKGGWIKIAPYTFLRIKGDTKKYQLIEAKNIPLAPEQFEFESTEDWKVFTLYFEPLPIQDCIFDIVEELNPNPNDFNYSDIELITKNKIKLNTHFH